MNNNVLLRASLASHLYCWLALCLAPFSLASQCTAPTEKKKKILSVYLCDQLHAHYAGSINILKSLNTLFSLIVPRIHSTAVESSSYLKQIASRNLNCRESANVKRETYKSFKTLKHTILLCFQLF